MNTQALHAVYLASAICFILSLKWLSEVPTARRGVISGIIGMALAVGGTLLDPEITTFIWIVLAIAVGAVIGVPMALMPMTAVPQRTALSHAFGALAAALVGTAHYCLNYKDLTHFHMAALAIEVILGSLTVTASLMAAGKLQEVLPTRPITYRNQNFVNLAVLALAGLIAVYLVIHPDAVYLFPIMVVLCLTFGVFLILPIGGADMPTVIALLNSYAGLSASMMGFVLNNKLLIIAGALDGSSGLILSIVMCKAMNRSFSNVLFGAFGQVSPTAAGAAEARSYNSASPEEAADIMLNANSVMIIPGYGMAVSQAQHAVRELYDVLTARDVTVNFAIHPVAGRMPGHMNVLLAEADVPYETLLELEDANHMMSETDVALVIGANDVTNPGARDDKNSPIYGMPIIESDRAKTVMVIKRSMNPGFAGIDNELYYLPNTLMLFGDAKQFTTNIVKAMSHD